MFNQGSLTYLVQVRTNLRVFNLVLAIKIETLSEIVLPAWLPNLYIKKYSNSLQPVRVMVFLYAITVSLIKCMFYIKNKKAVDLKLQDRIRRNNSFIRHLSPETLFVWNYLSSCPKAFCKKGVFRNFSKFTGKPLCWSVFLINLQAWGLQLYYKKIPAKDVNFARFFGTPNLHKIIYAIQKRCSKKSR